MKFQVWVNDPFQRRKLDNIITERWFKTEIRRWYGRINTVTRLLLMVHGYLAQELVHLEYQKEAL